jgi:cytochrome c peroxidase
MDGEAVSVGHRSQKGRRNAPSVYNAAGQRYQFWDGRRETVEEQAKEPVLNPTEMAMPGEARVLETLRSIPGYFEMFQAAFPGQSDPITYDNFGRAIGAFERTLVTPAPWDSFLAATLPKRAGSIGPAPVVGGGGTGAGGATSGGTGGGLGSSTTAGLGGGGAPADTEPSTLLDEKARFGFLTFFEVGCPTCHSGALVGGSLFEKLGRVRPWPNQEDTGRFEVTGGEGQKMTFKVASLRNVARTAPYFHDASSTTLADAVRRMAEHQLGVELTSEQVDSIVAFLESLTGDLPTEKIAAPILPVSGPVTPKPDPT